MDFDAYLKEAASFDDDRVKAYRRSERRAWAIAACAVVAALCGVAGMAAMAPLKTVMPPVVVRVDRTTGVVDTLTALNGEQQVAVEDAERKYWLKTYVQTRESYAWPDREASFRTVSLMSSKQVQEDYAQWFAQANEHSPQREYGEQGIVEVHVLSVALGTTPEASANVRFERIATDRTGQKQPPQRMVATVTFRFVNEPLKEKYRLINPRGFQVTAYRLDTEVAR